MGGAEVAMRDLPIDAFLERVSEMPEIEALEQLEMRRENAAMQLATVQRERAELEERGRRNGEWRRLGQEVPIIGADLSRLNLAIKQINRRMDAISWAKAVMAIYGAEGFAACREWMAATSVRLPRQS